MAEFASFDGARIAFEDSGAGFPTVLLHGFLTTGADNYEAWGIGAALRTCGLRTIVPDLRGHGASAAPDESGAYPADVLAMDQESLLKHLNIRDYNLVGYSLGARTAVRMLARGAAPRRCILAGMGDSGITDARARSAHFESLIRDGEASGDPRAARIVAGMMTRRGLKSGAMLYILAQQRSTPGEILAAFDTPILVISGEEDEDNGSAEGLARLLPNARARRVPGNHLSAVVSPELAAAIADFLTE